MNTNPVDNKLADFIKYLLDDFVIFVRFN
jgi:hypothetical protein